MQAVSIATIEVSSIMLEEDSVEVRLRITCSQPVVSVNGLLKRGLVWEPCSLSLEDGLYVARLTNVGNLTVNVRTMDSTFGTTLSLGGGLWES